MKLAVRRRPYPGAKLARSKHMQYRRNKGNGTWMLKVSEVTANHGQGFAQADDFDESDCKTILSFFEAQDDARNRRAARWRHDRAPITVGYALADYKADLISRGANPYNAGWPRRHLTSALLAKPVALLGARELKHWRDSLLGTLAPSTINRLIIRSAPHSNCPHSTTSGSKTVTHGKPAGRMPNAQNARNVGHPRRHDPRSSPLPTGRMISRTVADTLAVTGLRPSQAARLRVEDFTIIRCVQN